MRRSLIDSGDCWECWDRCLLHGASISRVLTAEVRPWNSCVLGNLFTSYDTRKGVGETCGTGSDRMMIKIGMEVASWDI